MPDRDAALLLEIETAAWAIMQGHLQPLRIAVRRLLAARGEQPA